MTEEIPNKKVQQKGKVEIVEEEGIPLTWHSYSVSLSRIWHSYTVSLSIKDSIQRIMMVMLILLALLIKRKKKIFSTVLYVLTLSNPILYYTRVKVGCKNMQRNFTEEQEKFMQHQQYLKDQVKKKPLWNCDSY